MTRLTQHGDPCQAYNRTMTAAWVRHAGAAVKRHPVVTASIACVVVLAGIAINGGGSDAPPVAPAAVDGSAIKPPAPAMAPAFSVAKMTPSRPGSTSARTSTPTVTPTVVTPTVRPQSTVVPSTQAPPPVKPTKLGPWKNCTEAKAHGRCNIQREDSDYAPKLDRDKDGVACEC